MRTLWEMLFWSPKVKWLWRNSLNRFAEMKCLCICRLALNDKLSWISLAYGWMCSWKITFDNFKKPTCISMLLPTRTLITKSVYPGYMVYGRSYSLFRRFCHQYLSFFPIGSWCMAYIWTGFDQLSEQMSRYPRLGWSVY